MIDDAMSIADALDVEAETPPLPPPPSWFGGRDYTFDQTGEAQSIDTWTFRSTRYPGLVLSLYPTDVFGARGVRRGRLQPKRWRLSYDIGRRGWSASGKCRSIAQALRDADARFVAELAAAWALVWSVRGELWRWGGGVWEHVGCAVNVYPEQEFGRGTFALCFPNERPYYVEVYAHGSCGGSRAPDGVQAIDAPPTRAGGAK
mgnify:FL=1